MTTWAGYLMTVDFCLQGSAGRHDDGCGQSDTVYAGGGRGSRQGRRAVVRSQWGRQGRLSGWRLRSAASQETSAQSRHIAAAAVFVFGTHCHAEACRCPPKSWR